MKELVGSVELFNRVTGDYDPANVFRGLDSRNLEDFTRTGKPALMRGRSRFSSWTAAADANVQDSHWDWIEKAKKATQSLASETFAIECNGSTQGLMLVDTTKFARLEDQRGKEIVYVELVATAPWNRPQLVPEPQYKGVGRVLIGTAISLSVDLEFKGRVGLHSLPQSETWYRMNSRFADLGFDETKEMRYFEMTEAQAVAFLSNQPRAGS